MSLRIARLALLAALFASPATAQTDGVSADDIVIPPVTGESEEDLRRHMSLAFENERCPGALAHAFQILETMPDDADAKRVVSRCMRKTEEVGRGAIEMFENSKILRLVPELLEKVGAKEFVPIIREVETKDEKSVTDLLMLSTYYEKLGEPEKEIAYLEEAIAKDPDDPRALLLLASKKWAAGEKTEARSLYRQYVFSGNLRRQPYLAAYVAAMSWPLPAMAVMVGFTLFLGALVIRRMNDRLEFLYGEFKPGPFRRAIPWLGMFVPLILAFQFLTTGKALPFGLLIVIGFLECALLTVPPAAKRLRPYFDFSRRAFGSIFTTRFASYLVEVPTGWRVLIAVGTLFVLFTVAPIIDVADVRYALTIVCALLFFGTVGSLIVTFLRHSDSLRTSLRWLGFAATLPFLAVFLYLQWGDVGSPLMRGDLPDIIALRELGNFLGLWLVAVIFATHLSRILADALVAPVRDLMKDVAEIERGNFKAKVEVTSKDELGALAEAVNRMAEGLERREFVEKTFSQYVDSDVAKRILTGSEGARVTSARKPAVVLFSDIRGFTRISEKLEPEQVVTILNDYFKDMVPAIKDNGGVIDKFIGDAIMAVWGVPEPVEDAPIKAVRAAVAMRDAMEKISDKFVAQGFPKVGIGIGINMGEVVAGTIGWGKVEYTVIGDVVNTAQRGESNAMAQQILITEPVYRAVADRVDAEALEGRLVKGKSEPVYFWSVRSLKEGTQPLDAGQPAVVKASGSG